MKNSKFRSLYTVIFPLMCKSLNRECIIFGGGGEGEGEGERKGVWRVSAERHARDAERTAGLK